MSLVHFDGIGVRIGAAELLHDVSVDVEPGQLVMLVGPNGAGKSTLLSLMSGERHPTSGRGQVAGRSLETLTPSDWARLRAHLPQRSGLQFPFAAREVVALGRLPFGRPGAAGWAETQAVVDETLDIVDGTHLAKRNYLTLSGGEQQRIQLARVLAQAWPSPNGTPGAALVLLDEPTSNLDWGQALRLMKTCRALVARGMTVVAVLHDLRLAREFADHVILLSRGTVAAAGPPAEVLTPSRIATSFDLPPDVIARAFH